MARAWLEDVIEVSDVQDGLLVTTALTSRRPLHTGSCSPADQAPPRSRAMYYGLYLLNVLIALTGLAIWVSAGLDGEPGETIALTGCAVILASAIFGMFVSELKPEVCTCRNHRSLYEECR